jgi:hypothetical protein
MKSHLAFLALGTIPLKAVLIKGIRVSDRNVILKLAPRRVIGGQPATVRPKGEFMTRGLTLAVLFFLLSAGAAFGAASTVPDTTCYQKNSTGALTNSVEAIPQTFTFRLYDEACGGIVMTAQSSTGSTGSANAISVTENLNSAPSAPPPANDKIEHKPEDKHIHKPRCPDDPEANPSKKALAWALDYCSNLIQDPRSRRPFFSKGTPEWQQCVDRTAQRYDCAKHLYTRKERSLIAEEARRVCFGINPHKEPQDYAQCLDRSTLEIGVDCINYSTVEVCIEGRRKQVRRWNAM